MPCIIAFRIDATGTTKQATSPRNDIQVTLRSVHLEAVPLVNHLAVRARSQLLTAVLMKMPCRLADVYRRFEGAYYFLRHSQAVQGDSFETSEDFNLLRPHIRPTAHSFACLHLYSHVPFVFFIPFFLSLVLSYSLLKASIHISSMAGFHPSYLWYKRTFDLIGAHQEAQCAAKLRGYLFILYRELHLCVVCKIQRTGSSCY
jgi:hypothetical protein